MKLKLYCNSCEIPFEDSYYDTMIVGCDCVQHEKKLWLSPMELYQIEPETRGFSDKEKALIWNRFIEYQSENKWNYEIDYEVIARLNNLANNPDNFQRCLDAIVELIKKDEVLISLHSPVLNHNFLTLNNDIELPSEYLKWFYFSDGGELGIYQFYGIAEKPEVEIGLIGYEDEYQDFICIGSNGSGAIACKSGAEKIYAWNDYSLKFEKYGDFTIFLEEVIEFIKE